MKGSLIIVLVAALVAAGCGGGTLDRKELLTKANAICTSYEAKQNDVQFPSVNPIAPSTSFTDRARWGAALNQIVQLGRREVDALRALRPPKELEARFRRLVDAKDAAFNGLAEAAEAAKRNRPARIKTTARATRAKLATVAKLAKKLGVKKCA